MSVKIFVDLDEVLGDWLTPALYVMGYNPTKVIDHWNTLSPRPWDVFKVIDMTPADGWRAMNMAGDSFWANIPLLPHAKQLIKACESVGETTILTSPSLHPSSYSGKVKWLDYHFGTGFARKRALIGASKHVVARPNAILIDDSPAHCREWAAEGGDAILFPGYGNELWEQRERALAHVLPQLREPWS